MLSRLDVGCMAKQYRIYLDLCCLNRPFDDSSQDRIRLEAEAVLSIYERCRSGEWQLLSSDVLETELRKTPDRYRMELISQALVIATEQAVWNDALKVRSDELVKLGLKAFDAAHVASAEHLGADVFMTTDDRLQR
jgi:predicted nucleic acid-binding protein